MTGDSEQGDGALPVKVIRSERRTKSSAARVVNGTLEIRIPAWMDEAQEAEAVDALVRKIDKKRSLNESGYDLAQRARSLAVVYDLPAPREIKWVTNQSTRWGSCSYDDGVIRISSRLVRAPEWVVDYVILHELTHLVESGHTAHFHELMRRYPKAERAEGFLEAMGLGMAHASFLS